MRKRLAALIVILLLCIQVVAQFSREGAFETSNGIQKSYALYFPSSFKKGKSMPVVLAFHPLHTLKWNARSWRNELQTFAERNQVILICPDGGKNGRTDDPEDLDFARQLIMKMLDQYDVYPNCIYAMGFGWGANAALKMAIRHRGLINGLLLVGINSQNFSSQIQEFSKCFNLPCYIIHGKNDQLQRKYYPIRKLFNESGACVKSCLVPNLGHTFGIPHRINYLTRALVWLENTNCNKPEYLWKENQYLLTKRINEAPKFSVNGLVVKLSNLQPSQDIQRINVYNRRGILIQIVRNPDKHTSIKLPQKGSYTFSLLSTHKTDHFKVEVTQL